MALDVRWWNLSVGALTLAIGCTAPPVDGADSGGGGGEGGSSDDGSADDGTDPDGGSESTTGADTNTGDDAPDDGGDGCGSSGEPCADGLICVEGYCEHPCLDVDYGEGCYECFGVEDCIGYEICTFDIGSECVGIDPEPECDDAPVLLPLTVDDPGSGEIIGLSFVDADGTGGEDLLVSRSDGATILRDGAGPLAVPVPDGDSILDAGSADFDGDALPDLVVLLASGVVTTYAGDGAGGLTPSADTFAAAGAEQLEVLDFNGDDLADVAIGGTAGAFVLVGAGDGTFSAALEVDTFAAALSLSVRDGGQFDELAVANEFSAGTYVGTAINEVQNIEYVSDGGLTVRMALVTDDAFRTLSYDAGWMLIRNEYEFDYFDHRYVVMPTLSTVGDVGDLDADGQKEMFAAYDGGIVQLQGADLDCYTLHPLGGSYGHIAIGDFDGDGADELALADGSMLAVYEQ